MNAQTHTNQNIHFRYVPDKKGIINGVKTMRENGVPINAIETFIMSSRNKKNVIQFKDTSKVGVLSHIKDYTNKKGDTFKAHFTIYDKYLGKCSVMGDLPCGYKGNVPFNETTMEFRFNDASIDEFCDTGMIGSFVFLKETTHTQEHKPKKMIIKVKRNRKKSQ